MNLAIIFTLYFLAGFLFMLYVSGPNPHWNLLGPTLLVKLLVILCWPCILISLLEHPPEDDGCLVSEGRVPAGGSEAQDSSRREVQL